MSTTTIPSPTTREPELAGQTVVVIGGSLGIGFETARRARSEGAQVVITGRNPEQLQRAASELGALKTAAFDATDPASLERFFRDLPTPIADQVILGLRSREDTDGYVRLLLRPNFQAGDKIRILDGAFADCLGLYEGMRDSDRVAILLDLLGRKVRVTVDADAVAVA